MKTRALFPLMLAIGLPLLADDPLPQDQPTPTVRDVPLGASVATVVSAFKTCDTKQIKQLGFCIVHGVIGSVSTDDAYFFDEHSEHGSLTSVVMTFSTANYSYMREVFDAKFGQPTSVVSHTFKNSLGASYDFETAMWVGKTMVVVIEQYRQQTYEYAGRQGAANFQTRAAYDKRLADAEAKRKKALTDF